VTTIGVRPDAVVDEWLYARLSGDATLRSLLNVPAGQTRVANMVAPKEWPPPFVVFHQALPMRDVRGWQARIMGDGEYLVRAIGRPANWGTLRSVADRLDVLLEGSTGTTSGGTVLTFHRQEAYRLTENDAPERDEPSGVWHYVGAIWRVQVS
jgi:hypothetical protein